MVNFTLCIYTLLLQLNHVLCCKLFLILAKCVFLFIIFIINTLRYQRIDGLLTTCVSILMYVYTELMCHLYCLILNIKICSSQLMWVYILCRTINLCYYCLLQMLYTANFISSVHTNSCRFLCMCITVRVSYS